MKNMGPKEKRALMRNVLSKIIVTNKAQNMLTRMGQMKEAQGQAPVQNPQVSIPI